MTKQELMTKLQIDEKTLNEVLKSCAYTEVKNFHAIHENVIKSFLKKADIKTYTPNVKESIYPMSEINNDKVELVKTKLVSDTIENVEVVTVRRKELIELLSRAYHKGIEDGKNSMFIADKNRLEEIFEEAINRKHKKQ